MTHREMNTHSSQDDSLNEERFILGEATPWSQLVDHKYTIPFHLQLEETELRFKKYQIAYMPVLDGRRVCGLASEREIARTLSLRGGIGTALYGRDPVSRHLLPTHYAISIKRSIRVVLEEVFKRDSQSFFHDVILVDEENLFLGVIEVRTLVYLQHHIFNDQKVKLAEQVEVLEILTNQLNIANRELSDARDEAMQATRFKSEFLANMSHEIRTPMNGILGMNQALLDSPLTTEQKRWASIVASSGKTLLRIINDILDFSKIEAGKMTLEAIDFDLEEVMNETVQLLADQVSRKGIDLFCHISPDVPTRLIGDPTRLRQVVMNLTGNAVKFTDHGQVIVRVHRLSVTDETVQVRVAVSDTGIGISLEAMGHLFQSFSQADSGTTRRHGGTGLGLSISKRIVEIMGGQMGAESEPGKGSTFWFEVAFPRQMESPPASQDDLRGMRVLLINENPTILNLLATQLDHWRMVPFKASSISSALGILQKQVDLPPDLVILDPPPKTTDGLALVRKIRENTPHPNRARFILFTHFIQRSEREKYLETGVDLLLEKPIKSSLLFQSILQIMGRRTVDTATVASAPPMVEKSPSLHLLIVEDSPINQEVLLLQLKQLGHTAEVAHEGPQALRMLAQKRYDGVLMDGHMPGMDGFETTRCIRNGGDGILDPGIYIIAVTADAMQDYRERCLEAGMNDYVTKPVTLQALATALAQCPLKKNSAPLQATEDQNIEQQLVDLFITETAKRIAELKTALSAKDGKSAVAAAHTIQGSAGYFGAHALSAVCNEIENLSKEGYLNEAMNLLPQLDAAMAAEGKMILPLEMPCPQIPLA